MIVARCRRRGNGVRRERLTCGKGEEHADRDDQMPWLPSELSLSSSYTYFTEAAAKDIPP